jgi:hypothetical protein
MTVAPVYTVRWHCPLFVCSGGVYFRLMGRQQELQLLSPLLHRRLVTKIVTSSSESHYIPFSACSSYPRSRYIYTSYDVTFSDISDTAYNIANLTATVSFTIRIMLHAVKEQKYFVTSHGWLFASQSNCPLTCNNRNIYVSMLKHTAKKEYKKRALRNHPLTCDAVQFGR